MSGYDELIRRYKDTRLGRVELDTSTALHAALSPEGIRSAAEQMRAGNARRDPPVWLISREAMDACAAHGMNMSGFAVYTRLSRDALETLDFPVEDGA